MTPIEKIILIAITIIFYLFIQFMLTVYEESYEAKKRVLDEMNRIPRANYSQFNKQKHGKAKKSINARSNPGSR